MPRKDNLSPTGTYALAKNIAKVNTTGIETDVQFSKSFGKSNQLLSTLGLIWLNSKSDNPTPSFYISSHARFLTNLSIEYLHKRFSLSSTVIYKNRKPQKAAAINADVHENCFMLNAKGRIFFCNKKLSAFVEVDNVFDTICSDLLGSNLPGRWLMGGLSLSL
jgi:iron complex outermembrane receptor protein